MVQTTSSRAPHRRPAGGRSVLHRVVALAAATASAAALAWPDQPITLLVPYTPGTGVDAVARQLAARLPSALGQPVVVENVVGASGTIGTERVARAKPDGHTLLVQSQAFVMSRSLYRGLAFDPMTDFAPVSLAGWGSLVLLVPATPGAPRTLAEFIAAATASPGKLTYATPGVGTPHHLASTVFLQKTGLNLLHVPYKGTTGAVADLLGGRVDCMFLPINVALPHIQSGKVVALATGSLRRLPQLPQVPTLAELKVDVGSLDVWYGVLAPKGTPAATIDRLNHEIAAALATPALAAAFEAQGIVPMASTPAEFGRLLADENVRWTAVVERAGIRGE
ncbi:MAG: tripartite tricarboxylate transporter substrate binding protein [Burkholderiales bacterium]